MCKRVLLLTLRSRFEAHIPPILRRCCTKHKHFPTIGAFLSHPSRCDKLSKRRTKQSDQPTQTSRREPFFNPPRTIFQPDPKRYGRPVTAVAPLRALRSCVYAKSDTYAHTEADRARAREREILRVSGQYRVHCIHE